ncbi:MAG: uracil-DNA glycosylase family protein [Egibacteraceae bacterium]
MQTAAPLVPERPTLPERRSAVAGCQACALWEGTTQTVLGEGPAPAPLLLVGEQPGDREDREGHPFVGPAGRELGEGLDAAGTDRGGAYVTNVVKHPNFTPRGKRRIHAKPKAEHITACWSWLHAAIAAGRPAGDRGPRRHRGQGAARVVVTVTRQR